MKLIKKMNQHRRDCDAEVQCEECGNVDIIRGAYDDSNYWINVLPSASCSKCGKSTKDLGIEPEKVTTKYHQNQVV